MDSGAVSAAASKVGFYAPRFAGADLFEIFRSPWIWKYFSIIIPMAVFNVLGSLQNLESAEAAGDRYETRPSLAVNGIGTLIAAFFGSCFPTTIYIGHPGWKGLGARTGYSVLNGIFVVAITLFGMVRLINTIIPMEAGIAIVLWIGIIISAQAFQATPRDHAPAVVVGLFPAFAAWGINLLKLGYQGAGRTLSEEASKGVPINGFRGMLALERGFIFTSMIMAAISVFLIEREFSKASLWSLAAAVMAFFGVIHTYEFSGNETISVIGWNTGGQWAFGYFCFAALFMAFHLWERSVKSRTGKGFESREH
jgi:AGZA family xanthine/uracil permease-like MFS transporter